MGLSGERHIMLQYRDHHAPAATEESAERDIMAEMARAKTAKQDRPLVEDALMCGIGRLVCSWGTLEARLEQKIGQLRQAAGDVRLTNPRQRPTMPKMMAELRAIVSMRNRRNNVQLIEISEIERTLQQIDKFRMLVLQGFQAPAQDGRPGTRAFLCRDAKNNAISVSLNELETEVARLDQCRERLLAL